MSLIRTAIDDAVADAMAEHPKYFTPKGHEHARIVIVRKIMAALRGDADKAADDGDAKPLATPGAPIAVEMQSREAAAYMTLRIAAGAVAPFRMGDGRISIPPEGQGEDVMAFADAPPQAEWPFIADRKMIAAWHEFFRDTLPGVSRRPISLVEGGQPGIRVPWPWPPARSGKVYAAEEVGQ